VEYLVYPRMRYQSNTETINSLRYTNTYLTPTKTIQGYPGALKQRINNVKINNKGSDEYYTPPEALEPLLSRLDKQLVYYEATSGVSSAIVDYMKENGFSVVGSEGRDFLLDELPEFDAVLTNPPYSIRDKFIEKCYELDKPFALLLPVNTLQGVRRGKYFKTGLELIVFNNRISFTEDGVKPHFGVAWFCKDLLKEKLEFIL